MREASISVVIPTRNRTDSLCNAVRSALAQTLAPSEVIVVIDGPEAVAGVSEEALADLHDSRVRVLTLPVACGGSAARNHGVRAASGEWIALLDDDDVWLPEKLAVQLAHGQSLPAGCRPIVSCSVVARRPEGDEVWPRSAYVAGQPLSEYLFCRRGLRYGSALLQTSTLLAPRELLLRVPFTPALKKHQDWDWLLRASREPGVSICMAEGAPLAVFHVGGDRPSVSRSADWRFSYYWALALGDAMTRRAFRCFLATECAAQAGRQRWRERAAFLVAAAPVLAFAPSEWVRALIFLCAPVRLRSALRRRLIAVL